jgi:hypothetical protein
MNYPRTNYEMTETDYNEIINACKPVPMIMLQCGTPDSPQENANRAWDRLGKKMGFDYMTVQPSDKGKLFFTAIPSETESARKERLLKEAEDEKNLRIGRLEEDILTKQCELEILLGDIIFDMDGDKITCARKDFTNLQECPCGFGDTNREAYIDLLDQEEKESTT